MSDLLITLNDIIASFNSKYREEQKIWADFIAMGSTVTVYIWLGNLPLDEREFYLNDINSQAAPIEAFLEFTLNHALAGE